VKELEKKIFDYLKAHEEDIIADIETLAKAESPTADKAACDACARVLAGLYKDRIGVTTELVPSEKSGDNLVSVYGEGDKTLLIVGHYDTVHPVGSVPLRREGNVLYGPGVCDMKGGDVMAIWALKALKELGVKLDKRVMVINNSDEETGSDNSRPLMLEKAKDCFACIVCEPAFGVEGKIKVARKGGGSIRIKCYGKAAHAGNNPADGVNANVELAHQILFAQSVCDYGPGGSTFTPNKIVCGGTVSNVISDYAEAIVDWRMCVPEAVEAGKKIFAERKAVLPGARVEFDIHVGHPPMADNEVNRALYTQLEGCAADLDMHIEKTGMIGGCSDGNDISFAGTPTIDGMGVVGNFMHNPNEQMFLEHLVSRTALLASYICRVQPVK